MIDQRTHMDSRTTSRAMISAIERARGRDESTPSARLFSLALMAVFFVALMGGLAAGATMYRSAAKSQTTANDLHLQAGLITGAVRSGDVAGAASKAEGPEGPALVLSRALATRTYETRIYQYQGQIVQEFAVAGRPYDPTNATPLLESQRFEFELGDGLVSFATDAGSFDVALRSDAERSSESGEAVDDGSGPSPQVETIVDTPATETIADSPAPALETIADIVPLAIGGAR